MAGRKAPAKGPVESALERDLLELAKRDSRLAGGVLAASAVALARELDEAGNSATSKSMCARALSEAWDRLLELAPAPEEKDNVDELKSRRAARRARSAGA